MQKSVNVVHSKHPLLPAADRFTHCAVHVPNETVAQLLDRVGVPTKDVVVQISGRPLTTADLYVTKVGSDDLVTVRDAVTGGNGSNVLAIVALVALTVFTYGAATSAWSLAGLTGLQGTALIATQAAVLVGGQLLISQLFPPKIPKMAAADTSPTYALTGGSNQIRPYAPLPLVMGSVRIYPDLGAKPYVTYEGEDQYLYQLFNFGLSDIELTDIKIGETSIDGFEGIEYQIADKNTHGARPAWTQNLVHGNVDTIEGGGELKYGVELTRTTSLNTTAIGVDIAGTLFKVNDKGKYKNEDVVVSVEFRKVGTETWYDFTSTTPWTEEDSWRIGGYLHTEVYQSVKGYVISNASTKPVRVSLNRQVEEGQYEVRIKKLNFDIPAPDDDGYDHDKHNNRTANLTWAQLRSYQKDDTAYTGQTRLGLSVKASGQFNGAIDKLNAIASAKCLVWNSGTEEWELQATSNPAWWYLWFARGKKDGDGKKVFGPCLPDSQIDLDKIVEWAAWCDDMNLSFNWVCDIEMSVHEVLETIARVGRAVPSFATGKLGVVYDKANLPVTQMFGMPNIRAGSFNVEYISQNLADEVVIEFINPEIGWQQDTVRAPVPGVSTPLSSVSYPVAGITDVDQAGREANLQAAAQVLFRKRVTFETDIEGLVCSKGDVISFSHDMTSWGASGRLEKGSTSTTLYLSRDVTFTDPEDTAYISIRHPNGYIETVEVQYPTGSPPELTTNVIQLPQPLTGGGVDPWSPSDDPDNECQDYIFQFDPMSIPGKKFKITAIEPLSENHVRITAREERDEYYEAEDGEYTYIEPSRFNHNEPAISNVVVTEQLLDPINDTVQVHVSWDIDGAEQTIVRVAGEGQQYVNMGTVASRSFSFIWYLREKITIQLTPISTVRLKNGANVTTVQYQIKGVEARPEDVAAKVPNVNGLMLQGGSGQTTQFTGQDAKFVWRKVASNAAELGSELQGGDSGNDDSWFRDYEVKVYDINGTLRRTEYVKEESYIYSFEKNFEDGGGTPVRQFTVEVRVRGTQNQISPRAARLTVSNPAPNVPGGIAVTGSFRNAIVRFNTPSDTDYAGVLIYGSTSSGFTPGSGNLLADSNSNIVEIANLTSGTTYYFRIAGYDKFGKSGLNISDEFATTTLKITGPDLSAEVIAMMETGDADISEELQELSDALDQEIADRLAAINALNASLSAAISSEASTRASADSALATQISTLSSTVTGHGSSITTINGTLSTLNGTVATHGTTLSSHSSSISGLLSTTATHSSQITTLSSDVSSAVSSISTLTSTVGSHTTTLNVHGSSIDGINAKYGIKINNNGHVTGYGLISDANNGTPTSTFAVLADNFVIAHPSGTVTQPFTVSGGVVYMTNAVATNVQVVSASSGERIEITNSYIRVYDSSNVLRVEFGELS